MAARVLGRLGQVSTLGRLGWWLAVRHLHCCCPPPLLPGPQVSTGRCALLLTLFDFCSFVCSGDKEQRMTTAPVPLMPGHRSGWGEGWRVRRLKRPGLEEPSKSKGVYPPTVPNPLRMIGRSPGGPSSAGFGGVLPTSTQYSSALAHAVYSCTYGALVFLQATAPQVRPFVACHHLLRADFDSSVNATRMCYFRMGVQRATCVHACDCGYNETCALFVSPLITGVRG